MIEYAIFRQPDGRAWLGEGPFEPLAAAPPEGVAFYWNDFSLGDPLPWKRPARCVELPADDAAARDAALRWCAGRPPAVFWKQPPTEFFEMAFRRIRRDVLARRLEKMVPVLTELGRLLEGRWECLLPQVLAAPAGLYAYGCVRGDAGFAGATPELLFETRGREVRTMALAGTAKPGEHETDFTTDEKEIEEHELVVGYLAERLGHLGQVTRQPRGLCRAGGLLHFQSHLSVELDHPADPTALVPWLHPTPAVGCLPREPRWLERLNEYRRLLRVPDFFGAPFGMVRDGNCQMVVAIRGVSWKGWDGFLPAGCGIVSGSAYDHEWRELRIKRESVQRLLGLARR
jgi:menaquinone-specific isochorismate synthase